MRRPPPKHRPLAYTPQPYRGPDSLSCEPAIEEPLPPKGGWRAAWEECMERMPHFIGKEVGGTIGSEAPPGPPPVMTSAVNKYRAEVRVAMSECADLEECDAEFAAMCLNEEGFGHVIPGWEFTGDRWYDDGMSIFIDRIAWRNKSIGAYIKQYRPTSAALADLYEGRCHVPHSVIAFHGNDDFTMRIAKERTTAHFSRTLMKSADGLAYERDQWLRANNRARRITEAAAVAERARHAEILDAKYGTAIRGTT